ncbi:autoinducer binding domain-containing protein [Vibrio tubiashii]|uniref:autoinducer binding domain-containing protein n=1 Tax=Vibrio tubiashii TaxID=29498 RepID=UPI001EFED716|nr:autoinducer binding domain-containing protein [Vibrio tubiashii]MCG9576090.1 autoinducer binding domain-containing protein [Vibrio tubiashii]
MKQNTNAVIEDYIQSLIKSETKEEIHDVLSKASKLLGFDYFAYGIRQKMSFGTPRIEMVNNYSNDWNARYQGDGLSNNDPLIMLGMKGSDFILWDNVKDESQQFWQEAKHHGIYQGWSKPTHSPNGSSSLFSFSRGGEALSESELFSSTPYMLWFSSIADQGFQKVLADSSSPSPNINLTPREIEVLKWTADGKTIEEISIILGLSSRTAEFHARNAIKKLGTANKTSAAVKAALLGLI